MSAKWPRDTPSAAKRRELWHLTKAPLSLSSVVMLAPFAAGLLIPGTAARLHENVVPGIVLVAA